MTPTHASRSSSASAALGTRKEDDEGRDPGNEFLEPHRALGELADAAQYHDNDGHLPPQSDAKRVRTLLVDLEVGILRERALSQAACADGSEVRLEKADDCEAFGPVEVDRGDRRQKRAKPIRAFRTLVCDELFKKHRGFLDIYRTPYMVDIQTRARSVLAGKQTDN